MRYVIKEPLALLAGALVILTAALVIFSLLSEAPEHNPVLGVALFSLIPLFALSGVVIFYLAIRSEGFRGDE